MHVQKQYEKKTWETIKRVINKFETKSSFFQFLVDSVLSDDYKVIAEKFNHYFASIGSDLAKKFPNVSTDINKFLSGNYAQSFFFLRPVHDEEIRNIINSVKEMVPGADNITANVLKCVLNYIVNPLTHICQLSLSQGYFPSDLKKMLKLFPFINVKILASSIIIVPFHNSQSSEKVMYDRLYDYLLKFEVLYSYQFGFQKNKSTYMAIICLMDKLVKALEKGEVGIGKFIDFRKAFDTVDHTLLLDKMLYYGIRGMAHNWRFSYLMGRQQYVEFNQTISSPLRVQCGVP